MTETTEVPEAVKHCRWCGRKISGTLDTRYGKAFVYHHAVFFLDACSECQKIHLRFAGLALMAYLANPILTHMMFKAPNAAIESADAMMEAYAERRGGSQEMPKTAPGTIPESFPSI